MSVSLHDEQALAPAPGPAPIITWRRPAGIFLAAMDSPGSPSQPALEILGELHAEEGLDFDVDSRGNSLGSSEFGLNMMWWDEKGGLSEVWKYPRGRYVIGVESTRKRTAAAAKVTPPGFVRHSYTDHTANPPRIYYYLLVRRSLTTSVTYQDIQRRFTDLGAKPEWDACLWVQSKIDALLGLWPDITYDE
ncbi:hypothetical protein EH165_01160 [Nakamurella antarctica]|uniref:Uncharacterized protein n=1 Tax=Nakamurella antarctica TaxID=1902245 RepID=A0A3G8ZIE6_9ACTN|nr:hypothetical protein EH165_01160 [Nakamurella antarctica]